MSRKLGISFICSLLLLLIANTAGVFAEDNSRADVYNNLIYPKSVYKMGDHPSFSLGSVQNESINPATGNLELKQTDVYLKGKNGLDFALTRYYSMQQANLKEPEMRTYMAQGQVTGYLVHGYATRRHLFYTGSFYDETPPLAMVIDRIYTDQQQAEAIRDQYNAGRYNESYNTGTEIRQLIYHDFVISSGPVTVQVPAYGTFIQNTTSKEKVSGIGAGWVFDLPYIEKKDKYEYLHLGSSGVWQIEFTEGAGDANLKDYKLKDMRMETYTGSFTNGQKTAKYVLIQKDGKRTYFADDGRLVGIEDRFGNKITFQHTTAVDGHPKVNKVIDSVGREINIQYDIANHQVIITVSDGYNTGKDKQIVYQLEAVNGLVGDSNGSRANGEFKLASVTDSENRTIQYTYDVKYARDSVVDKNQAHNNNPRGNYFEGIYNYYACLEKITYPTGATTHYEYNQGIKYSAKDSTNNNVDCLAPNDPTPDRTIKNCGVEGSMYFYKVAKRFDQSKDGMQAYNIQKYTYKDPTVDSTYDSDNSIFVNCEYDGYPLYGSEEKKSADFYVKSKIETYKDKAENEWLRTWTYKYDKKVMCEYMLDVGDDHRNRTLYEYDAEKKMVLKKTKNVTNPTRAGFIQTIECYDYNDFGDVVSYWGPKAEGNKNNLEHKVSYEYHNEYHYITKKTYKKEASTTLRQEYQPTTDGKSIQFERVFENNLLKKKTQYTYDTYGNVRTEKKYFLGEGETDLEATTQCVTLNYQYDGTTGRNAYATRVYQENIQDAEGNLVEAKEGNNAGTIDEVFEYDWFGNLKKSVDGQGYSTQYVYDTLDRATEIHSPDGSVKTYQYTTTPQENSKTTQAENNTKTKVIYDEFGNVVEEQVYGKDPATGEKRFIPLQKYIYDSSFQLDTEYSVYQDDTVLENGTQTDYIYQSDGRVKEKSVTNHAGNILYKESYTYDDAAESGQYFKVTKEIAASEQNPTHAPAIITTTYTNKFGELKKQERKHGTTQYQDTFDYDYLGNKTGEKTARAYGEGWTNAYTTQYRTDFEGKVIEVEDIEGYKTTTQYDEIGRVKKVTDPKGNLHTPKYSTTYKYDGMGRLLTETIPFEKTDTGTIKYSVKKYSYDRNGNKKSEKVTCDREGNVSRIVRYGYNKRNWLNVVKNFVDNDENGAYLLTQYHYDSSGNKLRMYTGLNAFLTIEGLDEVYPGSDTEYSVTRYDYDDFNRLTKVTDPTWMETTYNYYLDGSIKEETDRNGNVIQMQYDGMGRLLHKNVVTPDGFGDESLTYTYTPTGEKLTASNGRYHTQYSYDDLGRLVGVNENNGEIVKTYTYDAADNRKSFELKKDGSVVGTTTYTYDHMNRMEDVYDDGVILASYTYDDNGNRETVEYTNGNRGWYAYNLANQVTLLSNSHLGNNTTLSQYHYTYYLDGNQKSKSDDQGRTTVYTYDGLGRLTSEVETENGISSSIAYTYDDYSNRDTMTIAENGTVQSTTDYQYDGNGRLLKAIKAGDIEETTHYSYDNNGNQIYKMKMLIQPEGMEDERFEAFVAGTTQDEGVYFSTYNGFNQLKATTADDKTVTYDYDANGLRKRKTVNGVSTYHVWDNGQMVMELDNSKAIKARYVRGVNLIYGDFHQADGTVTTKFYLFNAHGDVIQLTNTAGEQTDYYHYDAFGNEKDTSPPDQNPFRYCGEYFDKETGTIYLRARYYDPGIGRFISEDSNTGKDEDPLSLNLYLYCGNNPIALIDPSGNSWENVLGGIGEYFKDIKDSAKNAFENPFKTIFIDIPYGTNPLVMASSVNIDFGQDLYNDIIKGDEHSRDAFLGRWGTDIGLKMLALRGGARTNTTSSLQATFYEYKALRLQGYNATQSYGLIKQFRTGINPGNSFSFHFTTLKGGKGITSSGWLNPGFGVRGQGIYTGTTPTPSWFLKHVPWSGWGISNTPVRIPIKIKPGMPVQYVQYPLKTSIFRTGEEPLKLAP